MNSERLTYAVRSSPLWLSPSTVCCCPQRVSLVAGLDVVWYWRKRRTGRSNSFTLSDSVADYLQNAGASYRSPNLAFDEFWYRHEYPDCDESVLAGRYRSGWDHYLNEGARKRYNPVFWFNDRWYQEQYPEVGCAVRSGQLVCGFEHYLMYGMRQDLSPSIYFNVRWYRERHMNGAGASGSYPIVQYLLSREESRPCPVPFFDESWYSQQYGIVPGAAGAGLKTAPAYEHYMLFGRRLGYSPSPHFDESAYLEMYPQVQRQIEAGVYASGFEHYVSEGPANGFLPRPHLDYGAVDYAGPQFIKTYEQSLLLHLSQLKKLCHLAD